MSGTALFEAKEGTNAPLADEDEIVTVMGR